MDDMQPQQRSFQNRDGSYQLPNDSTEHERLDYQARAYAKLMDDNPCLAPISNPVRILDVGCGTGIVTVFLAKRFPHAEVIGIDLSPVPDIHQKPDNVTYLQGDILDAEWRASQSVLKAGGVDYIYSRLLIFGMTDWPGYISTLGTMLRPEGWLELHEIEWAAEYDRDGNAPEHDDLQYQRTIANDILETKGLNPLIAEQLHSLCRSSGLFQSVEEQTFRWPSAPPLPKYADEHTMMYDYMMATGDRMIETMIEKICSNTRSDEERKAMLRQHKKAMAEREQGGFYKIFVVTAQKSL